VKNKVCVGEQKKPKKGEKYFKTKKKFLCNLLTTAKKIHEAQLGVKSIIRRILEDPSLATSLNSNRR